MPLPPKPQLLTLTHSFLGLPAVIVEPKDLDSMLLGYPFNGLPVIASFDASPPPTPTYPAYQMFAVF